MIAPDLPLIALASAGGAHMFYTDARTFEINPWAAGITGSAAIIYAATLGPSALASTILGSGVLALFVAISRWIKPRSFGYGDYSLLTACGAITGIDTIVTFFTLSGLFGQFSAMIFRRLRKRKRWISAYPQATAAIPAVVIAGIARFYFEASWMEPFSWVMPWR